MEEPYIYKKSLINYHLKTSHLSNMKLIFQEVIKYKNIILYIYNFFVFFLFNYYFISKIKYTLL